MELRERVGGGAAPEREWILNHDLIDIATIGEIRNVGDAFLVCASSVRNGTNEWYFPNGTVVSNDDSNMGPDIYVSRNKAGTLVRLNRRRNAMTPTGIYRCEVLGSSGITRSLYVGLYSSTGGI